MSERLIPTVSDGVIADIVDYTMPSKTYNLEYDKDSQIRGYCDEEKAMRQAIYKIINTERYEYIIYSWNYGIELADLFGKPIPFVYAEIQRRIIEALLADDRVKDVYDFSFSNNGEDVTVTFTASTIYGVIEGLTKEVKGIV